ncbi:YiiX/YebB-like N1pC/P60 family cysteine hydrolase [Gammaproteobacteria bacterium]|nr:YiiX/YebB-like N1pC/P60 family cysteine hydrolase [Gammaproteobacteria bacterium]
MGLSLYQRIYKKFVKWLTDEPKLAASPPCDFNRVKYELKPGDVILVEGRSRVSKVIRTITQSPWTHSAIYIGRFHDIEDHELRKTVAMHLKKRENVSLIIEGLPGQGIVVSPLNTYKDHHVRICRPIGLVPSDANLVISYSIKSLGKLYDVRHLLDLARFLLPWSVLPRRWGSSLFTHSSGEPDKSICSSLIAEAYISVKFPILPFLKINEENTFELVHRNPHLFTPKDFDYSPYFEIIKYPLFDPNEPQPYYRRLPWAKEGVLHQDQGIISDYKATQKNKKFLSSLLHKDKKTIKDDKTEPEENSPKPETD